MTLEQIKYRQNEINENLYQLVKENTQLIDAIVGQVPESLKEGKEETPQGLVEEILLTQNRTNALINLLYENNSRLYNKTYSSIEVDCAKIGS